MQISSLSKKIKNIVYQINNKNEGEKISSREVLGLISRHDPIVSPSARRIAEGHNLCTSNMSGTGKDGRITKEDVLVFLSNEKT